ncbi:MAG: transposase, partial [Desulfobacteraceae bacterium]|nr:transposase [Desulfobacteraceae bacterium]
WEDRYHATAIEGGEHFLHCLMYIDLNIVRAGVVNHPSEWRFSGYNEIQFPRRKCVLISYDKLAKLAGCSTYNSFQVLYKNSIAQALEGRNIAYDSLWTKNVAVGSKQFVENIKKQLKAKAVGRQIYTFGASDNIYELRESTSPYNADFNAQNANMGSENTYDLDLFPVISDC